MKTKLEIEMWIISEPKLCNSWIGNESVSEAQQKHLLTDIIDKSIDLITDNLIICQTIRQIICQTEVRNGSERERQ